MRILLHAVAISLLAACGSDQPREKAGADDADVTPLPDPEPFFRGGARIKARVRTAQGGAKTFLGFRDVELGVECDVRRDEHGIERCLPSSGAAGVHYADGPAGPCASPVIVTPSTCPEPPKYVGVSMQPEAKCAVAHHTIFAPGVLRAPPPEQLYATPNYCFYGQPPGGRLVHEAIEVAASNFVAFERTKRSSGDLSLGVVSTADGAETTLETWDATSGRSCMPWRTGIGNPWLQTAACAPRSHAWSTAYSAYVDPGCTERAAYFTVDACEPQEPTVAFVYDDPKCRPPRATFRALGERIDFAHARAGDTCTWAPFEPTQRYFRLGAPIDPATFPSLRVAAVGTGRLRALVWTKGRMAIGQLSTELFDLQTRADCVTTRFADGKLRCVSDSPAFVHTAPGARQLFLDDACTVRLAVRYGQPECRVAPIHALTTDAGSCNGASVTKVSRVGAPVTSPLIYTRDGAGACTFAAMDPSEEVFRVGAEIMPDSVYEPVEESIE